MKGGTRGDRVNGVGGEEAVRRESSREGKVARRVSRCNSRAVELV